MSLASTSAKLTLSYPLYAADFDPNNNDFLIVGGGGGEGRNGVANKITLINSSQKHEISEVVDVDLSRDEDSVTSLAIAQSSDTSATVFAGINSSSAEQQAGKNEHLRSFKLGYPPKKKTEGDKKEKPDSKAKKLLLETKALGKVGLFSPSSEVKKETYQRVIRLSPPNKKGGKRLGAIATGLAPSGEIVVFDATKSSPSSSDIRRRIQLAKGEEAADVDLIESKEGGFLATYATDYEVYLCTISSDPKKKDDSEPVFLYGTPHPDVFSPPKKRPTFRALRFLTPNLILLLQNLPDRGGAELLLLSIPSKPGLGDIVLRKILHKNIKSATALSVALLAPPEAHQNMQHVIAVGSQDISILSIDHSPTLSNQYSMTFRTHALLRNLHPNAITSLAFSTFTPPADPSIAPTQYLKLASTSMACTLMVHTFPLTAYHFPAPNSKRATRYTIKPPSNEETAQMGFNIIVSIIAVALMAFTLQVFTEIRGGTPEYLGAKGWLSESLRDYIARPYMFDDAIVMPTSIPEVKKVRSRVVEGVEDMRSRANAKAKDLKDDLESAQEKLSLRELLSQRQASMDGALDPSIAEVVPLFATPERTIVVEDAGDELAAELHHDEEAVKAKGKRWEDLGRKEKEAWKRRLVDAGEWTVKEGEDLLKGVFFGGLAGVVADAVAGA